MSQPVLDPISSTHTCGRSMTNIKTFKSMTNKNYQLNGITKAPTTEKSHLLM